MADAKKKADAKPPKKAGKAGGFLIAFALCAAMPFVMPSVVLVLIAMIPTYVAFFTDNDPQKSGAVSVGVMNFAGIIPFLIDLWKKGQTLANAFQVIGSANSWLIILGAAAIGQMIVYAIPQAIATLTLTQAESRLKALRKNLDMLKEFWGPEVATTKPLDKIIQD